jgi:hypothetical protein
VQQNRLVDTSADLQFCTYYPRGGGYTDFVIFIFFLTTTIGDALAFC